MKKSTTPDERFLIAIYKRVKDGNTEPFTYLEIAKSIGQKETASKNIAKHLAQANFIRKVDDDLFELTDRGIAFVEELLNS